MLWRMLAVVAVCSLVDLATAEEKKATWDEKVKEELNKLDGEWELTDGKPNPLARYRTLFKGGVIELRVTTLPDEKEVNVVRSQVKIDPSKTPKQMDQITLKDGKADPGSTIPLIYELDGDTLRVAFGYKQGGNLFRLKEFPKEGAEKLGELHVRVLTYKRAKEK